MEHLEDLLERTLLARGRSTATVRARTSRVPSPAYDAFEPRLSRRPRPVVAGPRAGVGGEA